MCLFVQLLGELLLDRSNVKVMVKFVSELEHLKTIMDLLRDQSRSIQFEAFHVFKVCCMLHCGIALLPRQGHVAMCIGG